MTRVRLSSSVLAMAFLVLLASSSLHATRPFAIVLHGGGLQKPIVLHPEVEHMTYFWTGGNEYEGQRNMKIPAGLEGTPYFDYDVFWGQFTPEELLKPEMASQHGRLYLRTSDRSATVVLTAPVQDPADVNGRYATPMPVPRQLQGFVSGRKLSRQETAELVAVLFRYGNDLLPVE